MSALQPPWHYPRWIAHRGAGKLAPENTLAAFRLGAAHGYRMFECDVKLSADDVPFLLHDATLERTTSSQGLAGSLDWSTLAKLDAGHWHSNAYNDEPLPTLESITRFCLTHALLLNIEIKPSPGAEAHTGEIVAREAARLWQGAPVAPLLSSFQMPALQAARAAAPELPRALLLDTLCENWVDSALSLGCVAVVLNYALWDALRVQLARRAGLRLLAYTVNDPRAAQELIELGIDGIITDRVDLFRPDREVSPAL